MLDEVDPREIRQDMTTLDRMGQDKTRQDKTRQDMTRCDNMTTDGEFCSHLDIEVSEGGF